MAKWTARELINEEAAKAAQTETFAVEAWGSREITVRRLAADEVLRMRKRLVEADEAENAQALLEISLVEPPFTPDEIKELLGVTTIDAIGEVLKRLNEINNLGEKANLNGKEVDTSDKVAYSFPVVGAEPTGLHEAVAISDSVGVGSDGGDAADGQT